MKKVFLLLSLLSFLCCFSQNQDEEIKKTVTQFFDAMFQADTLKLKETFSENIVFQTIKNSGEVKNENANDFAAGISKFSKGDLNEKFKIKTILNDGQLASVWMDYQFLFKGKISHCGVNSFQLVKKKELWKVQYIIDTRRKCTKNDDEILN